MQNSLFYRVAWTGADFNYTDNPAVYYLSRSHVYSDIEDAFRYVKKCRTINPNRNYIVIEQQPNGAFQEKQEIDTVIKNEGDYEVIHEPTR